MRAALQVAAVVLLRQCLGPLVQRGVGQDPGESLLVVNAVSHLQPWASVGLIVSVSPVWG
jgi:hypothetical protein